MNRMHHAIGEIHRMDAHSQQHTFFSSIHPCVKLLVTVVFLVLMTSYGKYNLSGLLSMCLFLLIVYQLGEISLKGMFLRMKEIFFVLFLLGAANLFFDRTVITHWGTVAVTGGMFSCITLYIKGIFAILASYALMATTGIENICYALQVFHLPRIIIICIMLTYRYLIQFIKEVDRVSLSYSMRAPGQRGIHIKAWGSVVGNLLLRSMDRSEIVYESMQLRGFQGQMRLYMKDQVRKSISICYGIIMIVFLIVLRIIPVFEIVGRLL